MRRVEGSLVRRMKCTAVVGILMLEVLLSFLSQPVAAQGQRSEESLVGGWVILGLPQKVELFKQSNPQPEWAWSHGFQAARSHHSIPIGPMRENKPKIDSGPSRPLSPESTVSSKQGADPPGDFVIYSNQPVQGPGLTTAGDEPSLANNGDIVFYIGNWYAARSPDAGRTWVYDNPYADMSDFCCDQDVVFDTADSIFVWYRQGNTDTTGSNRLRLCVSSDASTWSCYDLHPNDLVSQWAGLWFDFPSLALSFRYLYATTNMFSGTTFQRSVILRLDLVSLRDRVGITGQFYSDDGASTFAPVHGATATMYWGTHVGCFIFLYTDDCVRLYTWREGSDWTSISSNDIGVYNYYGGPGGTCPSPDGGDICSFNDDRIIGGWVAHGIIGFYWDDRQGSACLTCFNYPFPYIDIVRISESTQTVIDFPIIWNANYAFKYGYVAPDSRGDLGLVVMCSGASASVGVCSYPTLVVGMFDEFSSYPPDLVAASSSNHGTTQGQCFGDYQRARRYTSGNRVTNVWIASGSMLQGAANACSLVPRYVIFGRARDADFTFDFSISNSGPVSVVPGDFASNRISVNLVNGPAIPVSLDCPAGILLSLGIECLLSPPVPTDSPPYFSTLTVYTQPTTPLGSYTVLVEGGSSNGLLHTTSFTLTVTKFLIPDFFESCSRCIQFSIQPPPFLLATTQSSSTTLTSNITVTSINNWSQPVNLTGSWVAGTPPGTSFSLNPGKLTPPPNGSAHSSLDITLTSGALVGNYTLRVFGTYGKLFHSVDVVITIYASPPAGTTWPRAMPSQPSPNVPVSYYKGVSRGYGPSSQGGQGFLIVGDEIVRSFLSDQSATVSYANPFLDRWVVVLVWDFSSVAPAPVGQTAFAPKGVPNGWDQGSVAGCATCRRMDIQYSKLSWGYPTSPSGSPISSSQVKLSWTSNTLGSESNFWIERKVGQQSAYVDIASVGQGITTYLDSGLDGGTTYFYRIRAYNSSLSVYTQYSLDLFSTTLPNAFPVTTNVFFGDGSISPSCSSSCLVPTESTVSANAQPSKGWAFASWTVSGVSCSGGISVVPCNFTMPNNPVVVGGYFVDVISPTWPLGARLSASSTTPTSIVLSWTTAADNAAVADYVLYRENVSLAMIPGKVNNYTVSGLKPGQVFTFHVVAVDAANNIAMGPSLAIRTPWPAAEFRMDWADFDNNGVVNILDIAQAAFCFDRNVNSTIWPKCAYWDFSLNKRVDIVDIAIIAIEWQVSLPSPHPGQNTPPGIMDRMWLQLCSSLGAQDQAYCLNSVR